MNKEFTSKSSLTSFCAESSEKNFNGLPGNKGHSNTAGGKSGAAHQRDWYFNRRKCCHDDAHLAAAHRLPDTKNVKHQLIVKFVHRDKREEMYIQEMQESNCERILPTCCLYKPQWVTLLQATIKSTSMNLSQVIANNSLAVSMTSSERTITNTYGLQMGRSC